MGGCDQKVIKKYQAIAGFGDISWWHTPKQDYFKKYVPTLKLINKTVIFSVGIFFKNSLVLEYAIMEYLRNLLGLQFLR